MSTDLTLTCFPLLPTYQTFLLSADLFTITSLTTLTVIDTNAFFTISPNIIGDNQYVSTTANINP